MPDGVLDVKYKTVKMIPLLVEFESKRVRKID